jgi:hypothetical protein
VPYVSIYGRRPNKFQIGRYVRAVQAGAGMRSGMGGFGMGQDDSGDDGGNVATGFQLPTTGLVTGIGSEDLTPIGITATSPTTGDATVMTGSTPTAPLSSLGTAVQQAYATATSPSSGGGFNIAAFMTALSASAGSAVKLYNSTQAPSLIPGTSSIFNPATGQILGAGLTSGDTSSLITYGGIALLAFVAISIFSSMGKK